MTRGVWVSTGILACFMVLLVQSRPDDPGKPLGGAPQGGSHPRLKAAVRYHGEYVSSIAVSADGSTVAAVSPHGSAMTWNPLTSEVHDLPTGLLAQPTLRSLSYSPDGTLLAGLTFSNEVVVWEMPAGKERRAFPIEGDLARSFCFTRDGTALFTTGPGKSLQLWDIAGGGVLATVPTRGARTTALDLSPDGQLLVVGDRDGAIVLVDRRAGTERTVLQEQGGIILQVAFSPDGATLASASVTSRHVVLWDVASGRERAKLEAGAGDSWATCLSFSRDGKLVATAESSGRIHLRDVASARELLVLRAPKAWIWALAFAPDGRTLYSGGADSVLRAWDLSDLPRS